MKLIDLFEEDDEHVNEIVKTLEIECSDMLEAYRQAGKVLYRGTNSKGLLFSKASIRQDRRPVEMDEPSHNLINKALASLDLPTRGNSLFVSADLNIASTWGEPTVIFIPDGWKGLVYDKISAADYSFDKLESAAGNLIAFSEDLSEEEKVKKMTDSILKLKPRVFKTTSELQDVLDRQTADILIHGKSYYKLSMHTKHYERAKRIATMLGIKL